MRIRRGQRRGLCYRKGCGDSTFFAALNQNEDGHDVIDSGKGQEAEAQGAGYHAHRNEDEAYDSRYEACKGAGKMPSHRTTSLTYKGKFDVR